MALEAFKSYFPNLASKVKKHKEVLYHEVEVWLDDGRAFIFDEHESTLRSIPAHSKYLTEDECRKEFGYRLRKILQAKGVSQHELSELTGISRNMITYYILGKHTPSFYAADLIAKTLNISLDELRYF
jgi:ribosome-binding protein aMBF1 (putative translation factor)